MKKFFKDKLFPLFKRILSIFGIVWLVLILFANVGSCFRKVQAASQTSRGNFSVLPGYVDYYIPSAEFIVNIPGYAGIPIDSTSTYSGITLRFALDNPDLYPEYYSFDNISFFEFTDSVAVPSYGIVDGLPSLDYTQPFSLIFDFPTNCNINEVQYYDVYYEDAQILVECHTLGIGRVFFTVSHSNINAFIPDYLYGTSVRFTPATVYYNQGFDAGVNQGSIVDYERGYTAGYADAGGVNPFLGLMNAIVFVPVNMLWNLLNFNMFGINLFGLFSTILTLLVVIWVVKAVK